jgi:1-acyl-sn-glycerol-3-phosphate acyltransferase
MSREQVRLDSDRISAPEAPLRALERRFSGRYPIDPFGLDPQLADLLSPLVGFAVRVHIAGGEHVPDRGPAVIVANRTFGVVEPAALSVAVQRATGRRLRVVGAPALPFIGSATRRLGAIAATEQDLGAVLRAGHLVAIPLSPTWVRAGAGAPPHALMQAMTHTPIVPAIVMPAGPFGTPLRGWHVRFGPLVTLAEVYDPNDPLAAARFSDAMREAVAGLLEEV